MLLKKVRKPLAVLGGVLLLLSVWIAFRGIADFSFIPYAEETKSHIGVVILLIIVGIFSLFPMFLYSKK